MHTDASENYFNVQFYKNKNAFSIHGNLLKQASDFHHRTWDNLAWKKQQGAETVQVHHIQYLCEGTFIILNIQQLFEDTKKKQLSPSWRFVLTK